MLRSFRHTPSATVGGAVSPRAARPPRERLAWLLQLRWGAIALQLLVLAVARLGFGARYPQVPWAAMFVLVGGAALVNLGLIWFVRHAPLPGLVPLVLVLDVLSLTAMLLATGGAAQPLCLFYLLPIVLAALLLDGPQGWGLLALALAGLALVLGLPGATPAGAEATVFVTQGLPARLGGAAALAGVALFVMFSVRRVAHLVRRHDVALRRYGQVDAQNERLAMLSSFAANAAHELGSPLATISLAAQELARALDAAGAPELQRADAALIGQEVARCRAILQDLSARAGTSMGELPVAMTLGRLEDALRSSLSPRLLKRLEIAMTPARAREVEVLLPLQTLLQILRNLIRNGVEAQAESGAAQPVLLSIEAGERLVFRVRDHGPGLAPAVRRRLGQPFVSTKGERGGLGLGLYLAHAFAQRAGGSFLLRDGAGGGTEVELSLPPRISPRDVTP